jgi:hypothetical protein
MVESAARMVKLNWKLSICLKITSQFCNVYQTIIIRLFNMNNELTYTQIKEPHPAGTNLSRTMQT